jgi:hypothetical protein
MAVWSATLSPHARHDAALRATKSSRFRHATRQRGGGCGRISPGDSGRGHVNGCGGRVRVPHTCPPCESPMPDPCPVRCCVPRPPHIGGSLLAGKRAGIAVLTSPLLPTYDLSFFFSRIHTHTRRHGPTPTGRGLGATHRGARAVHGVTAWGLRMGARYRVRVPISPHDIPARLPCQPPRAPAHQPPRQAILGPI